MAAWNKKGADGSADGTVAAQQSASPKKRKRIVWIVVILVVVAAVATAAVLFSGRSKEENGESTYTECTVDKRDIITQLSYSGTLEPAKSCTITSRISGEIQTADFAEGDTVSKGDVLYVVEGLDTAVGLQQTGSSFGQTQGSYAAMQGSTASDGQTVELQAPIEGTIVDQFYAEGDILEAGQPLCTIFDLRYLNFTMNVDELDITQVKVGQKVTVTAQALEGETFEGEVTKVSINGTTVGGITSYPVTVRIDDTDGLLPGMNVDASVVVSERLDAVSVPVEAVKRGNLVLKKTDSATAYQEGNEESIPAGYEYVEVTLGSSNDDYIEVLSGLEPGDQIAYIQATAQSSTIFDAMGMGMGGGMMAQSGQTTGDDAESAGDEAGDSDGGR